MIDFKERIRFMKSMHKGQKRIGGSPYYTHPLRVAAILNNFGYRDGDTICTALFHDLLEDTNATKEDIVERSNERVYEAVLLLTKHKGYDMNKYIEGIKSNELAMVVKLADRLHNLTDAVFADDKFINKYIKETEEYYIDLAKDTVFENDINYALETLKFINN